DPSNLLVGDEHRFFTLAELGVVPQQAMERSARSYLVQARDRTLVTEQALGRHQDQRLSELAFELAPQDMKIVRRRRAVCDLHVVLGAHLQKTLEPCRRVFRSLALVAVRQEANEPGHAQPFALARGDKLIEQDLCAVREISELRLPQRERI